MRRIHHVIKWTALARHKLIVVASGLVLGAVVWALTSAVIRFAKDRADAERIRIEAAEYAQATGCGAEVSLAVCELCMPPEQLARLSPRQLDRACRRYEDFRGGDRVRVARYCVGLLLSPATDEFDQERLTIARGAITSIITEFWNEPEVIGSAFGIAKVLGLENDPYLVDIAWDTLAQPEMPANVSEFIMRTYLAGSSGGAIAPGG